jgi:hypothetical protein
LEPATTKPYFDNRWRPINFFGLILAHSSPSFPWSIFQEALMTSLVLAALHHDYRKQRSFVTLEWPDDPEKRLGLPVVFKCTEDQVQAEAEKAIKEIAKELEQAKIQRA